jgi:hypothetical protein
VEAKLFVESLGSDWLSFVKIDDIPFLVVSIMSLVSNNWLSFSVLVSIDVEASLVLPVDEV